MALLHRHLVIALALKHVFLIPIPNWCTRVGGVQSSIGAEVGEKVPAVAVP